MYCRIIITGILRRRFFVKKRRVAGMGGVYRRGGG
jgi:hypothetical protein